MSTAASMPLALRELRVTDDSTADSGDDKLLLALTTQHFVLQSTRATVTGEAGSRAGLYVGALSSTLIALGFATQFEDVFAVLAGAVLPALLILGVFTYVRLAEIGVEDLYYVGRIQRIESYYRELSPRAARYFPAPKATSGRAKLEGIGVSPWARFQVLFTAASMIAAINSIVAGAAAALLLDGGLGIARGIAIAAAVVVALLTMTLHTIDEDRRDERMNAADAAFEAQLDLARRAQVLPQGERCGSVVALVSFLAGDVESKLAEEREVVGKADADTHRKSPTAAAPGFSLCPCHQCASDAAALNVGLDRDPPHVKVAVRGHVPPKAADRPALQLGDRAAARRQVVDHLRH